MGTLAGNGLKNLVIKLSFTAVKKIIILIYLLFTSQVPILLHSRYRCALKMKWYMKITFGSVSSVRGRFSKLRIKTDHFC